jgi:transposase
MEHYVGKDVSLKLTAICIVDGTGKIECDRNDAVGIARIMQCGWYKEVRVKDLDSHAIKALLVSRALLVKIKRDIENQIRGLLKNLGLVIGRAKMNVFSVRAAELTEDRSELGLRSADCRPRSQGDAASPRPTRFRRSRSIGAYTGLTTRRYASGEIDRTGRISKCGEDAAKLPVPVGNLRADIMVVESHPKSAWAEWRMSWQISASIFGRAPRGRDFQRQISLVRRKY